MPSVTSLSYFVSIIDHTLYDHDFVSSVLGDFGHGDYVSST